jgi:hypothetical protein
MLSKQAFGEGMAMLGTIYKEELNKQQVLIYQQVLSGLSDKQFMFAVQEHIKLEKWFPKPSELIALVDKEVTRQAVEAAKVSRPQPKALPQPRTWTEEEKRKNLERIAEMKKGLL